MHAWQTALAATGLLVAALMLLSFLILYCACQGYNNGSPVAKSRRPSRLYAALLRFGKREPFDSALRHSSRVASVWRTTYPIKPFNWSEHPALVAEAVEHGWASFAFTYTCSACPVPSNLWEMCTGCSHSKEYEPEITWEIGAGTDYMQKIRMNPGLPMRKESVFASVQALQTALPLPGPPLGALSFPQEGYFEITILAEGQEHNADLSQGSLTDNENVKLIAQHFSSPEHRNAEMTMSHREDLEHNGVDEDGKSLENVATPSGTPELSQAGGGKGLQTARNALLSDRLQVAAIGLAAGGAPPFRLPGCDPGSVGFHSNGELYLNGALHLELDQKSSIAARRTWGVVNATVGCGFDPGTKRVYFTLNGELAFELSSTSDEFGSPLHPTIAANHDVTVLANFGQSSFEYLPANSQRIPDPCFRRPLSRSVKNASGYEDSGDLFSMGRIDSQWLAGIETQASQDLQLHHAVSEAESDLFEIALDARS